MMLQAVLGSGDVVPAEACSAVSSAGNIHANHQAGLLFVDFDTGATLQISGEEPASALK